VHAELLAAPLLIVGLVAGGVDFLTDSLKKNWDWHLSITIDGGMSGERQGLHKVDWQIKIIVSLRTADLCPEG
jgi:hypothetical protein